MVDALTQKLLIYEIYKIDVSPLCSFAFTVFFNQNNLLTHMHNFADLLFADYKMTFLGQNVAIIESIVSLLFMVICHTYER